jgi:hypothetical protein
MLTHYLTRIASLPRAGGARSHPAEVQQPAPTKVKVKVQTERQKAVQRALDQMETCLLKPGK